MFKYATLARIFPFVQFLGKKGGGGVYYSFVQYYVVLVMAPSTLYVLITKLYCILLTLSYFSCPENENSLLGNTLLHSVRCILSIKNH